MLIDGIRLAAGSIFENLILPRNGKLWVQDRRASGSTGQSYTTPGTGGPIFMPLEMNVTLKNTIPGASVSNTKNGVFLKAGTYRVSAQMACGNVQPAQARLQDITSNVTLAISLNQSANGQGPSSTSGVPMTIDCEFTLDVDSTVQFQRYMFDQAGVPGSGTMGVPLGMFAEIYLNAVFEKI